MWNALELQPLHVVQVVPHELTDKVELCVEILSVSACVIEVHEVLVGPAEILDHLVSFVVNLCASHVVRHSHLAPF